MTPARPRSPVEPKVLVLQDVAAYLGLGSTQAADRWLKAHEVPILVDNLGYVRVYVREIEAAFTRLAVAADARRRRRLKAVG